MAFAAYGVAVLLPSGNGLIAVYVSAIVLTVRQPAIRECFERQADGMVEIVKLGIFVVFGTLLTFHGLFGSGWAAAGVVAATLLIARPVAVFAALAGTAHRRGDDGLHVVVRPQGGGHHDLLDPRALSRGSRTARSSSTWPP